MTTLPPLLRAPAPLLFLLACLLLVACGPEGSNGNGDNGDGGFWRQGMGAEGAEIYRRNCATCHGFHGYGAEGIFPPLRDNPVVTGPHVNTIMPVVFGRGAMPGFAGLLSDEELALVISYIRQEWGNNALPVAPGEIRPFRTEGIEVPLDPFAGGED
jgi:cytochrome c6